MTNTFTGTAASLGSDRELAGRLALRQAQKQAAAQGVVLDDEYVLRNHSLTATKGPDGTEIVTAVITV